MKTEGAEQAMRVGVLVTPNGLETEIDGHKYLILNSTEGHTGLISRLRSRGEDARIVCEESNGHEQRLVSRLRCEGFEVEIVRATELRLAAGLGNIAEVTPQFLAQLRPQRCAGDVASKSSLDAAAAARAQTVSCRGLRSTPMARFIEQIARWISWK